MPVTEKLNYNYRLMFRRASDGRTIPGGPVPTAWLEAARQQTRFEAVRKGVPSEHLHTIPVFDEPIFAAGTQGQISCVRMVAEYANQRIERSFELEDLFNQPAGSLMAPLAKHGGPLDTEEKLVFHVFAAAEPANSPAAHPEGVVAKVTHKPLPLGEGRLAEWLQNAQPCGPVDDHRDFPLFIRQQALQRAEDYCFKTGRKEGAAWLYGKMLRQWEPAPEIFAVAEGAFELRRANQTNFSFQPTAETFADLNRQMELRHRRLGHVGELGLVLVHNHPFEPSLREDGQANCPTCPIRETCPLTSSFYSSSDTEFHLSMFGSSQPWVCGMVIGLTPRREQHVRLFCLDGSRARERGYYIIPEE